MLSFCVCSGSLQAFVVLNEFEKAREDLEKVNKLLSSTAISYCLYWGGGGGGGGVGGHWYNSCNFCVVLTSKNYDVLF